MQPIVINVALSMFYVCLLVISMSCAKMAEPIKMLFGVCIKPHIKCRSGSPNDKGHYCGSYLGMPRLAAHGR